MRSPGLHFVQPGLVPEEAARLLARLEDRRAANDGTIYYSSGVANGGSLVINAVQGTVRSFGNVISGTGTLTKTGATTYILRGASPSLQSHAKKTVATSARNR